MRLWTLHPRYLDAQGLVALWREALLAKAVLGGKTRGYRHHPQLARFRAHPAPRSAINAYIGPVREVAPIAVASGQVEHEWRHLMRKLHLRDRALHGRLRRARRAQCHPLFRRVRGPVAEWERS
jgi:hypothetical protein